MVAGTGGVMVDERSPGTHLGGRAMRHAQKVIAYRMFEGAVVMNDMGWEPWVRTLTPPEVLAVARDLEDVSDEVVELRLRESHCFSQDFDGECDYVVSYLRQARTFTANLAAEGRGMVYMIG
jgi:hypothetical protein